MCVCKCCSLRSQASGCCGTLSPLLGAFSLALPWHSHEDAGCPVATSYFCDHPLPSHCSNCSTHSTGTQSDPPKIATGGGKGKVGGLVWDACGPRWRVQMESCAQSCPPLTQTAGRGVEWRSCNFLAAVHDKWLFQLLHVFTDWRKLSGRVRTSRTELSWWFLDHEAERGTVFCRSVWGVGSRVHPPIFWNWLLAACLRELHSQLRGNCWSFCSACGGEWFNFEDMNACKKKKKKNHL